MFKSARLLAHLDRGDIDPCRGGNHICLVDTTQGNTVDLVGASHQQQSALQLLQEDDALSAETTSEEDKDGSGGDRGAKDGGFGVLARLLGLTDVLSRIEAGSLGGRNEALAAILFTADRLFDVRGGGLCAGCHG